MLNNVMTAAMGMVRLAGRPGTIVVTATRELSATKYHLGGLACPQSKAQPLRIVPEDISLVHRTDVRYRRGGISLAPRKAIPKFFLQVGKHCARSLAKEASWKPCTGRRSRDVGRDLGIAISLWRRTTLLTKTNERRASPSPSPESCSYCKCK